MHSSRMRTVRCSDRLLGEGVCWGDVCLEGVSARGDVCPAGGCLPDTPSVNRMTDAYENYVADGIKKVWEGNVFTPVCHSAQSGWREGLQEDPPRTETVRTDIPWRQSKRAVRILLDCKCSLRRKKLFV